MQQHKLATIVLTRLLPNSKDAFGLHILIQQGGAYFLDYGRQDYEGPVIIEDYVHFKGYIENDGTTGAGSTEEVHVYLNHNVVVMLAVDPFLFEGTAIYVSADELQLKPVMMSFEGQLGDLEPAELFKAYVFDDFAALTNRYMAEARKERQFHLDGLIYEQRRKLQEVERKLADFESSEEKPE